MARVVQARMAASGVALLAIGAGGWLLFAPPGPRQNVPNVVPPPLVLPGRTILATGAATPLSTRTRARLCDGAEQAVVEGPRPLTPPQSWFTSDDYPLLALMAGHGGATTVELVVGGNGSVIGCGVAGSSGYRSLDTKTCLVFRSRAGFEPAHDGRGCPVAAVWHQRVRWVAPG